MEEDKTITIEIRQEVAVMLTFIVAGVIFVSVAFMIPGNSTELWPALNAGGIAAGIYLIAMTSYVTRKPLHARARWLALLVAVLVVGSIVFSWVRMKDQAEWQRSTLTEIRARMGQSVAEATATDCLLKTLETYYQQKRPTTKSLAEIFQGQNNGAAPGSNVYPPRYDWDSLRVYVQQLVSDRIVLVSQDPVAKGKNADFANYGGKKGLAQYRFTLTTKGMTYESEN